MRSLFKVIIVFLFVVLAISYVNKLGEKPNEILVRDDSIYSLNDKVENSFEYEESSKIERPIEGVSTLIGQKKAAVEKEFGKPARIDETPYGYDWWIYNKDLTNYIQIGIEGDKVVTVYVCSPGINSEPFEIGQSFEEIHSSVLIEQEVTLQLEDGSYKFELSEEDMNVQPLIQLDNIFAQLYIDKFDGSLSSIRFVDGPTLIKQ